MSKNLKTILICLTVLIGLIIAAIIYRMFFQFNQDEIKIYIKEEAEKYGNQKAAVYAIILDGVEYILSSHNKTQQVLRVAKASGTDKEQELVNAAINECFALKYLGFKK